MAIVSLFLTHYKIEEAGMRSICKLGFVLTLLFSNLVEAAEPVIVKLDPPSITSETIVQKIACPRPMREGRFNISTEIFGGSQRNKQIINCYGHGGSGWTTLFGSVDQAISLFEMTHPDRAKPIRIIGSGCMGLTCAVELSRLGYHVAGITTKSQYNICSWYAAGYFALVSVKTSPEEQANLNESGMKTFLAYRQIEQGKHPYLKPDSVRYMPVYCSEDTDSGLDDLEKRGIIPPKEAVTLDFGNGVVHSGYVKYMTYFMNTTLLMQQLSAEVQKQGIPIEFNELKSFDDVSEDVVFNCSGMEGES